MYKASNDGGIGWEHICDGRTVMPDPVFCDTTWWVGYGCEEGCESVGPITYCPFCGEKLREPVRA